MVGILVLLPGFWMAWILEITSCKAPVEIDSQSVSWIRRATTAILEGSSGKRLVSLYMVVALGDGIKMGWREYVTFFFVDEVHLDGEVLIVDAMLTWCVEVELLEGEG
jgi:hypothetical protein